jgi:methyl-accepting chemotaxis protein
MNRRKRKLIRLDLQLKVVFITLFVASFVLLINFELNLASLWSLSFNTPRPGGVDLVFEEMRAILVRKFLLSTGIALPLAATIGIIYSFKFSGPIYRFKKYFIDLAAGRWQERCSLRKGDDLKDVCEAINGAVESFHSRLKKDHGILEEVRSVLDEALVATNGPAAERLKRLREVVASECAAFEEDWSSSSAQQPVKEPAAELELTTN